MVMTLPLEQDATAGIPVDIHLPDNNRSAPWPLAAISRRAAIKYSGNPTPRMFSVIANAFIFGLMRTWRRQVTHVAEFGGRSQSIELKIYPPAAYPDLHLIDNQVPVRRALSLRVHFRWTAPAMSASQSFDGD
ncbi:MAG: hypothetical protein E5W44_02210 [Mesorhizobium sp.]|nr:MAG: hypothetical protein E5W44_02210 [Mesorhizobium sp.]